MRQGTRFRIFPTTDDPTADPVTVWLSPPAGSLFPGPEDPSMRAILPVRKPAPYAPPEYTPPYRGAVRPPAMPDPDGNFDWIPVGHPWFLPAHVYASVRHTLDVWEGYLGETVRWWHAAIRPQLELVSLVDWDNAQSGLGFIELGGKPNDEGEMRLFGLNFDVVAHETGHAILFSVMGVPPEGPSAAFLSFHESFSDLISLISLLHLPTVAETVLRQTRGNLYALNMVSRIGEMSQTEQIRVADNVTTMDEVADVVLDPSGEWIDLDGRGRNAHAVAQPLTGAVFDVLVELFQDGLVRRRAIPADLDARGWGRTQVERQMGRLEQASRAGMAAAARDFAWALDRARDLVGLAMQDVMRGLAPEEVSFDRVASVFTQALLDRGQASLAPALHEIFALRGIRSDLAVAPPPLPAWERLSYAEKMGRVKAMAARRTAGCACGPSSGGFLRANRAIRRGHEVFRDASAG